MSTCYLYTIKIIEEMQLIKRNLSLSHLMHTSEWEVSINRNRKHIICSTVNKVSIFLNIRFDSGMFFPSQNENR